MSARRSTSGSEFAFTRRRTTYSLALILACAAVWTSPSALTAAAVPRIALTVRIYQTAGPAFTLDRRALAEAETVLPAGLVEVRWQECSGLNRSPLCDVPPGPSELLLVVRAGDACHQDTSATLGAALVVRRAGGVLATVYVNCVASLATAARAGSTSPAFHSRAEACKRRARSSTSTAIPARAFLPTRFVGLWELIETPWVPRDAVHERSHTVLQAPALECLPRWLDDPCDPRLLHILAH